MKAERIINTYNLLTGGEKLASGQNYFSTIAQELATSDLKTDITQKKIETYQEFSSHIYGRRAIYGMITLIQSTFPMLLMNDTYEYLNLQSSIHVPPYQYFLESIIVSGILFASHMAKKGIKQETEEQIHDYRLNDIASNSFQTEIEGIREI